VPEAQAILSDVVYEVLADQANARVAGILSVKRENQTRTQIARHPGIRLAQYRWLTPQQIDEVWYGMGWLLRPLLDPRIGTVVNLLNSATLQASRRPQPTWKPYTR
jgi:hypothetical protein